MEPGEIVEMFYFEGLTKNLHSNNAIISTTKNMEVKSSASSDNTSDVLVWPL